MYDKGNTGFINPTVQYISMSQTLKFLLRGFGDNVNEAELLGRLK